MYTPPQESLGQVLPVFFSTLEMEEYRDACEVVYGTLMNYIDQDGSMSEYYRRKMMRHCDTVWDLGARLNLAASTERMSDG